MTADDIPRPLRRHLLLYAADTTTPEHERDRVAMFFPGIDRDQLRQQVRAIAVAGQYGRTEEQDRLIAELIQQDQEQRNPKAARESG